MPEGILEWTFQFTRRLEKNDTSGAYEVFRQHPELVRGLSSGNLVAMMGDLHGKGMTREREEFREAINLYVPDGEKIELIDFQQKVAESFREEE